MVAALTVMGGAGFNDATTTTKIKNLNISLYGFLTKTTFLKSFIAVLKVYEFYYY